MTFCICLKQNSWADQRWCGLVRETIPEIAKSNLLRKGGEIWLPNIGAINDMIALNLSLLDQFFDVVEVSTKYMHLNPLYVATERARSSLLKCSPPLENENQIKYLTDYSAHPFYMLRVRDSFAAEPKTHKKPRVVIDLTGDV